MFKHCLRRKPALLKKCEALSLQPCPLTETVKLSRGGAFMACHQRGPVTTEAFLSLAFRLLG